MTSKEQLCLRFLSDKMEATAAMVGVNLQGHGYGAGEIDFAVGRGVLGSLRRQGLVMRLRELRAWRLTKEGRECVKTLSNVAIPEDNK